MSKGKKTRNRVMNQSSEIPEKIHKLSELTKDIKGNDFPHQVLRRSLSDLIYILEKIEMLIETEEEIWENADTSGDAINAENLLRPWKLIQFYSQCLLLWGSRIFDILKETRNIKIPHDIRLARNILAAHYGSAYGSLTSKLDGIYIITHPKISPNGNLTYHLCLLSGPSSIASPSELLKVKQLYKKYCHEDSEPNMWYVCYKILCQDNMEITDEDLSEIIGFLKNNGGTFTTSFRVIDSIIKSLNESFRSHDK
jgi:hypothetical protein